jgi:hypothetical protein
VRGNAAPPQERAQNRVIDQPDFVWSAYSRSVRSSIGWQVREAAEKNAKNILIIQSREVAKEYLDNSHNLDYNPNPDRKSRSSESCYR